MKMYFLNFVYKNFFCLKIYLVIILNVFHSSSFIVNTNLLNETNSSLNLNDKLNTTTLSQTTSSLDDSKNLIRIYNRSTNGQEQQLINQDKSNLIDNYQDKKFNINEKINEIELNTKNDFIDTKTDLNEDNDIFNLKIDLYTLNCIFVRSDEGDYTYYSEYNSTEVCGFYSIAAPSQLIEYEFEHFNISCNNNLDVVKKNSSLVSVVDGWELNGQLFPSVRDHQLNKLERFKEFCSINELSKMNRKFRVSQNVGLIQFRILNKYEGFKVRVRFVENPRPCNVVYGMPQGFYTLKNYGQHINCSLSILFPESFKVLSNSIGLKRTIDQKENQNQPVDYYDYFLNKNQTIEDNLDENENSNSSSISTTTILDSNLFKNECKTNSIEDYVEIKGGDGLDTDLMIIADQLCFLKHRSRNKKIDINCNNTAVRLVSSGFYENSITIAFNLLDTTQSTSSKCLNKFFND